MKTYYILTTKHHDLLHPKSDFICMNCFQSEELAIETMQKAFIDFLGVTYTGNIRDYAGTPKRTCQRIGKREAQATRGLRRKKWAITKKEIDYENLLTHYIVP